MKHQTTDLKLNGKQTEQQHKNRELHSREDTIIKSRLVEGEQTTKSGEGDGEMKRSPEKLQPSI